MIGRVIGGYRVLEMVGQGSNGTVWRAEHPELKNQVAIKFLPSDLTLKESDRERFVRGARAVARLNHPGIATVFAAEFAGESPFIISEFVAGQTVNALTARGPLPCDQAVELTLQAARALRYAHGEGVFHRDISGGNIMMTPEGRAKIVDFGMAVERDQTRMTSQGTVFGTIAYMAPETLRGSSADESRDTYALGVILYQLLTGRLPFVADTTEALVYLILTKHAKPPSVHKASLPAPLDRLVLLALDKDPRRRCTLDRLIGDLEALQATGRLQESEQTRRMDASVAGGIGDALWKLRRRLTTLAPSHVRKLALTAALSLGTVGLLGWAVSRVLPQGPVHPKVASLAILPFFNESPEGGFEYIGHGLAEHLAERLAGLEGLLVQPYRRTLSGDAEELTTALHVEGVLEGSFSVRGGEVQTRIDLVRRDGKRVTIARQTSQGYKQAASALAAAAAKGLKSRLTTGEAAYVSVPAAASNEAFDALSTAIDAYHRGDRDGALRWYERAASLDPGLAKAYVGLGSIHYNRFFHGLGGLGDLEAAESQFRQALALEPGNGGAERGLILVYYERCERDSMLAIAKRASSQASAMDKLLIPARAFTINSMPELAVPLWKQAVELDPSNEEALWFLVVASAWDGQYEEAIHAGDEYLRRFGEEPEVQLWRGMASWRLGKTSDAGPDFERQLARTEGYTRLGGSIYAGDFFQAIGDESKARRVWSDALQFAERMRTAAPGNIRLQSSLCGLYARLGFTSEYSSEIAAIDSIGSGGSIGGAWDLWIPAAHAHPAFRKQTVAFLRDHADPRSTLWSDAEAGMFRDLWSGLSSDPDLAPIFAAARAYDDSLRQKYGLPPRKGRALS